MTTTSDPLHLATPAALSVLFQVPLSRVQQALRALQARPSVTINGIEHFDESVVCEPVRAWLNECCASDAKQPPVANPAPR